MSSQGPITSYLLTSNPLALNRATTHPFLLSAGRGTLPKSALSRWLSQDRLYAQSYIRFIGLLLSKIRLPARNPNSAAPSNAASEQHAIDVLIDALVNIRNELIFFETTAAEYSLDLTAITAEDSGGGVTAGPIPGPGSGPGCITTSAGISTAGSGSCPGFTGVREERKSTETGERENEEHGLCATQGECQQQQPDAGQVCYPPAGSVIEQKKTDEQVFFGPTHITHAYSDLFMSAGSPGVSVLEGLAVLWATEVCYLGAWRYAASVLEERTKNNLSGDDDADGGALRQKIIPNWSSAEFEAFVNRIGDVLDEMAGQTKGAEEAEMMRGRCLEWWRQVVWLEERFWPEVE